MFHKGKNISTERWHRSTKVRKGRWGTRHSNPQSLPAELPLQYGEDLSKDAFLSSPLFYEQLRSREPRDIKASSEMEPWNKAQDEKQGGNSSTSPESEASSQLAPVCRQPWKSTPKLFFQMQMPLQPVYTQPLLPPQIPYRHPY